MIKINENTELNATQVTLLQDLLNSPYKASRVFCPNHVEAARDMATKGYVVVSEKTKGLSFEIIATVVETKKTKSVVNVTLSPKGR